MATSSRAAGTIFGAVEDQLATAPIVQRPVINNSCRGVTIELESAAGGRLVLLREALLGDLSNQATKQISEKFEAIALIGLQHRPNGHFVFRTRQKSQRSRDSTERAAFS